MFQIDANNLPFVQTRQALLVLDLQNDFIATSAILNVDSPAGFVDKIIGLVPGFRSSGNVIWIRSCFEASRRVNEPYGESENVITDTELNLENRAISDDGNSPITLSKDERNGQASEGNGRAVSSPILALDEDEDTLSEAYLTIKPGQEPYMCLPTSPGTNFTQDVLTAISTKQDLIFQKSWYSAFRDGNLVQILRAKFVTEIFICGALTNISVFATAMDAARHGYGITIVEDCLGYRSKARHEEALRRLVEFTGCEVMKSDELMHEIQEKAKKQRAPVRSQPRPRRKEKSSGLEDLMSNLNLSQDGSSAGRKTLSRSIGESNVVAAESAGSSRWAETNDSEELQLPPKPLEAEAKKRDRVRTRIKTRRRPSNPPQVPKEGESSIEKSQSVSTASTSQSASQPLTKLPEQVSSRGDAISSPNPEAFVAAIADMKPKSEPGSVPSDAIAVHPDYAIEAEPESSSSDDGSSVLCEGDTSIITNLLDGELADGVFEKIRDEVRWQKMSHQGGEVPRLVAVQGDVAKDGSIPIYRHPADESPPLLPFSQTISLIRNEVEKRLGHSVNHVLIQFYRNGTDYISEHSDKTLDIVPESFIANVSLGAQRTMVFRTKRQKSADGTAPETAEPRKACRAPLPHNSMCKMGLATNMRWLHGIRQDKRMASEKMAEELAFQGGRISLTFRLIGTFLDKDQQKIWGQGATSKTQEQAQTVVNGNTPEAEKMIRAFGKENQSTEFDWKAAYGEGFDVLHISNTPKLFLSGDLTADLRVKLYLAEHNIDWTEGKLSPPFTWKDGSTSNAAPEIPESLPIKFVDNDLSKSTVVGDFAIMLYLDAVYGPIKSTSSSPSKPPSNADLARQFSRLQQQISLRAKWRAAPFSVKPFQRELRLWEAYALEAKYLAGSEPSIVDFALFPIIEEIRQEWKNAEGVQNVVAWYFRIRYRDAVMRVMGPLDKDSVAREKSLEGLEEVRIWE